jgi:hypothetical protein
MIPIAPCGNLTKSMHLVRRYLSWIVFGWLACQSIGMAAAPLELCCAGASTATSDEDVCCPGLLPGQVCPMHHTREGHTTCKMRGVCGSSDAALFSLSGGIGVVPQATSSVTAFALREFIRPASVNLIARAQSPDAPPPRR